MRTILYFSIVILASCTSTAQNDDVLSWDAFEIIDHKTIEIEYIGIKDSIDWPIFNDSTYALENTSVIIEGYFYCMETTNLETLQTENACILAIAKEPTIKICGVPQYRQNEFIRISGNPSFRQGKKVKVKGILHINEDGSDENLISMENASIVK